MEQQTFLWEEPHASHLALQDCEVDWMTTVVTWPSSSVDLLLAKGPSGCCGRTSPAACRQTEGRTLVPSSEAWQNAGMGSHTEFLTLSLSEWNHTHLPSRSVGGVCSLSDIVEMRAAPRRYYLTAKACRGVLRRAEKRGKALPPLLQTALQGVAGLEPILTATEG